MPSCMICGNAFPNWVRIDGKLRNLKNRKYCLSCSPFGNHNTKKLHSTAKDRTKFCIQCGNPVGRRSKYCSFTCRHAYAYQRYIERWKRGEESGCRKYGQLSVPVRRYMLDKVGHKCQKCGWSEVNPYTGSVPLEINHIDGNWRNCTEDNLEVVCPNCHALTPTYRALNAGKGRPNKYTKWQWEQISAA